MAVVKVNLLLKQIYFFIKSYLRGFALHAACTGWCRQGHALQLPWFPCPSWTPREAPAAQCCCTPWEKWWNSSDKKDRWVWLLSWLDWAFESMSPRRWADEITSTWPVSSGVVQDGRVTHNPSLHTGCTPVSACSPNQCNYHPNPANSTSWIGVLLLTIVNDNSCLAQDHWVPLHATPGNGNADSLHKPKLCFSFSSEEIYLKELQQHWGWIPDAAQVFSSP